MAERWAVTSFLPFLPAQDFAKSEAFYRDLGFTMRPIAPGLIEARLGPHGFLLQDFYVRDWAENFMVHVMVAHLDDWWRHVEALDLPGRYGVQPPRAPVIERSGLRTGYVWDPAGVLWHFADRADERGAA